MRSMTGKDKWDCIVLVFDVVRARITSIRVTAKGFIVHRVSTVS